MNSVMVDMCGKKTAKKKKYSKAVLQATGRLKRVVIKHISNKKRLARKNKILEVDVAEFRKNKRMSQKRARQILHDIFG